MNLQFSYDPLRELDNVNRGTGLYSSGTPSKFAIEAEQAGVDMSSAEAVGAFATQKIAKKGLDPAAEAAALQESWGAIATDAIARLDRMFDTTDPFGTVRGYLTLSRRCAYIYKGHYFYVSLATPNQMGTVLHELMHFYTHLMVEPMFVKRKASASFGEFKESLTVLINSELLDLVGQPDSGYQAHAQSRAWIQGHWKGKTTVPELAEQYLVRK